MLFVDLLGKIPADAGTYTVTKAEKQDLIVFKDEHLLNGCSVM
jgi:hypothetical protein